MPKHEDIYRETAPSPESFACLVLHEKGTLGYIQEFNTIMMLREFMIAHGFGRIPQLTGMMEQIWRNRKEAIATFEKFRNQHLEEMRELEKQVTDGE